MPAKSAKQFGFMAAHMDDKGMGKGVGGLSPSVAKEFVEKTPASKRAKFAKALANKRKHHEK